MGAAILDLTSWGPPSWTGSRGGRHLGSEVVGAAILVSWGPPSWTGSDVKNAKVPHILLMSIKLGTEYSSLHESKAQCELL